MNKSKADILIESMTPVFELATAGFAELCKLTNYKSSENYSKSASNGDYSKSASSGDSSQSASSGYSSQSASSGDSSKSASSGDYSKSASSGDYSQSASSGYFSQSASSGDYSKSASSGHSSKSASSGYYSQSVSSGDYSQSASSGDYSKSASSGHSSKSASNGDYSQSASSGDSSKSASSGDYSQSASSGDYSQSASNGDSSKSASNGHSSKSASSGDYSQSASNGNYSQSASNGNYSASSALGYRAMVSGKLGSLLMCSEYKYQNNRYIPVGGKADIVDGKILKPNCWYIVENGEWVEVDYSDNIFSYVLSNKKGVKKLRFDGGKIGYLVTDQDGNTAHGKTIKEARKDLIYKRTAKFEGKLPKKATGEEWVAIYRALTGACSFGIKSFVEQRKLNLSESYTAKEILKLAAGQFGADKFEAKVREGYFR